MDLFLLFDVRLLFGFLSLFLFMIGFLSQREGFFIGGAAGLLLMGLISSSGREPVSMDFYESRSPCEKAFIKTQLPDGQLVPTRYTARQAAFHCEGDASPSQNETRHDAPLLYPQ